MELIVIGLTTKEVTVRLHKSTVSGTRCTGNISSHDSFSGEKLRLLFFESSNAIVRQEANRRVVGGRHIPPSMLSGPARFDPQLMAP